MPEPDLDLLPDEADPSMPVDLEPEAGVDIRPAPLGHPPALIRAWFDEAADAVVPVHDGTLATARRAADAFARQAKAANTRRPTAPASAPGAAGATATPCPACRDDRRTWSLS